MVDGMSDYGEREICGKCRGSWPCSCSPQAVVVVLREDVSERLARQMAGRNDPLIEKPYESPIQDVTWTNARPFCGHFENGYDIDGDQRIVNCRSCGAVLDPYDVLLRLARLDKSTDDRLRALRDLERAARQREADRKARAALRRHRYMAYTWMTDSKVRCLTCGGESGGDIHNVKPRGQAKEGQGKAWWTA